MLTTVAALAVLGQGTLAPARFQAWNPDASLSFELPKTERFVRQDVKVEGALVLVQDRNHPASMILASFVPGAKLSSHVTQSHAELIRLVPNKRVENIESESLSRTFDKAGLRFAAFAYPSGPRTGTVGSVCDAVAVHWETMAGVWTISANGDIGAQKAIQSVLEDFVAASRLTNLNQLAAIRP